MAGLAAERQEYGLITAINSGFGQNNAQPFTIVGRNGTRISGVVSAEKFEGRSSAGTEPYTDVVITIKKSGRTTKINISNKGDSIMTMSCLMSRLMITTECHTDRHVIVGREGRADSQIIMMRRINLNLHVIRLLRAEMQL